MSTTTPYPPGFLHILQPKKWCDKKQVSCEYANIHGRCMCTCCQRRDLEKERAMSLPVPEHSMAVIQNDE